MAVRTFGGPDGIAWTAWEVIPGQVSEFRSTFGSHLPRQMADGWLCFDCGSEKRRLYPLPSNWAERTEAELWFLCRAAEPVRARNATGGCDVLVAGAEPAAASGEAVAVPGMVAGAAEAETAGV
ncbi:MAG TPA: hypothetical protein VFY65_12875 [Longimicrobium sp.]|nr:hypothetical protein [Longimicrobium sp.]